MSIPFISSIARHINTYCRLIKNTPLSSSIDSDVTQPWRKLFRIYAVYKVMFIITIALG